MRLQTLFNAQNYDPSQSEGQLPVGKHPVIITDSEVTATKANDGGYLKLSLKVIDGPQAGATGVYRINLYNQNITTCEIAHKQMAALCYVLGVFTVEDTQALHNIPFVVEVGLQKKDPSYTEIKKVFDMNGYEPGKAPAQAAPQGFTQQPVAPAAFAAPQQPVQQQAPPQEAHQPQWQQGNNAPPQWNQQPAAPPAQEPAPQAPPAPTAQWQQPAQQQAPPQPAAAPAFVAPPWGQPK